jgi:predicted nucleotidyltransferase
MNPTELEPHQLMQRLADFMEAHEIAYRIVGSMASMVYGEPRFTNDVDIVVELRTEHVPPCAQHLLPRNTISPRMPYTMPLHVNSSSTSYTRHPD